MLHVSPKLLLVRDELLMKDFTVYAMPVLLNELAWGCGVATVTAIIGHLGQAAVAANSVAQVVRTGQICAWIYTV